MRTSWSMFSMHGQNNLWESCAAKNVSSPSWQRMCSLRLKGGKPSRNNQENDIE